MSGPVALTVTVALILLLPGSLVFRLFRVWLARRRFRAAGRELHLGHYAAAARQSRRLLTRRLRLFREDQGIAIMAGQRLATARFRGGERAEAAAELDAIVAKYGPGVRPNDSRAWMALTTLAGMRIDLGEQAAGLATLREVVAECERRWGADALVTHAAGIVLSAKLIDLGQPEEAVELASAAVAAYRTRRPGAVPAVRVVLGRALLAAGQLDEAAAVFAAVQAELTEGDARPKLSVKYQADLEADLAKLAAAQHDPG